MIFWFSSIIPRILGVEAITLWPFVFLKRPRYQYTKVILHELVHCAQIKQYGIFGFYFLYLKQWWNVVRVYELIPLEIEAYALQEFVMPKRYSIAFDGDRKWFRVSVDETLDGMRDTE